MERNNVICTFGGNGLIFQTITRKIFNSKCGMLHKFGFEIWFLWPKIAFERVSFEAWKRQIYPKHLGNNLKTFLFEFKSLFLTCCISILKDLSTSVRWLCLLERTQKFLLLFFLQSLFHAILGILFTPLVSLVKLNYFLDILRDLSCRGNNFDTEPILWVCKKNSPRVAI